MNALECAIKMETEAGTYYEKLAAATTVPELKSLFTLLAAAEQEHHDALVEMREGIGSAKLKPEFKALQGAACHFRPLLAQRDSMAEQQVCSDDYKQIIEEEEAWARFYEEQAAQEQDEGNRDILLMIAAEERRHLSIVENIYAFVESPKNFLAWGEFSNLKEY